MSAQPYMRSPLPFLTANLLCYQHSVVCLTANSKTSPPGTNHSFPIISTSISLRILHVKDLYTLHVYFQPFLFPWSLFQVKIPKPYTFFKASWQNTLLPEKCVEIKDKTYHIQHYLCHNDCHSNFSCSFHTSYTPKHKRIITEIRFQCCVTFSTWAASRWCAVWRGELLACSALEQYPSSRGKVRASCCHSRAVNRVENL